MVKCYVCKQEILPGNTYNEHIILNAIGGRLCSKDLICRQCAPLFDKIDAYLAKQFNSIANLLNIERNRGEPQPVRAEIVDTGEEIFLHPGGKPIRSKPIIKKDETGNPNLIIAKNERQAKEVLRGLKRKFPNLDVEEVLKNAIKRESQIDSEVYFDFEIAGDEIYRSVCKTAINFYIFSNGERDYIKNLIPYVKSEREIRCVKLYCPNYDFFPNFIEQNQVFHNLFVGGNSKEKVLYAVVQFFSAFQFLVLLSDKYEGEDFFNFYFLNILEKREYRPSVEVTHLPKKEILEIFNINSSLNKQSQVHSEKLFAFISRKQGFERLIGRAVKNALEKYPEGTDFTEEICQMVIEKIMEAIAFLIAEQCEIINQKEFGKMYNSTFD